MPRHDFRCPRCGTVREAWCSIYDPPRCACTPDSVMVWAPQPGSYAVDAYEPGQEREVECGGTMRRVESLHDIRKLENESEKRARNGEGQPMVWRDYSQNKSNFDQHTLAKHTDRPVTGYAEGTTGIDGKRFQKRVGDAVAATHGTV